MVVCAAFSVRPSSSCARRIRCRRVAVRHAQTHSMCLKSFLAAPVLTLDELIPHSESLVVPWCVLPEVAGISLASGDGSHAVDLVISGEGCSFADGVESRGHLPAHDSSAVSVGAHVFLEVDSCVGIVVVPEGPAYDWNLNAEIFVPVLGSSYIDADASCACPASIDSDPFHVRDVFGGHIQSPIVCVVAGEPAPCLEVPWSPSVGFGGTQTLHVSDVHIDVDYDDGDGRDEDEDFWDHDIDDVDDDACAVVYGEPEYEVGDDIVGGAVEGALNKGTCTKPWCSEFSGDFGAGCASIAVDVVPVVLAAYVCNDVVGDIDDGAVEGALHKDIFTKPWCSDFSGDVGTGCASMSVDVVSVVFAAYVCNDVVVDIDGGAVEGALNKDIFTKPWCSDFSGDVGAGCASSSVDVVPVVPPAAYVCNDVVGDIDGGAVEGAWHKHIFTKPWCSDFSGDVLASNMDSTIQSPVDEHFSLAADSACDAYVVAGVLSAPANASSSIAERVVADPCHAVRADAPESAVSVCGELVKVEVDQDTGQRGIQHEDTSRSTHVIVSDCTGDLLVHVQGSATSTESHIGPAVSELLAGMFLLADESDSQPPGCI